jgi:tripartite-type tricarboxylate transporter receptor subunit TctC
MQARTRALGIQTTGWSAAEFDAFVATENALWRPLIRELGIRLDA